MKPRFRYISKECHKNAHHLAAIAARKAQTAPQVPSASIVDAIDARKGRVSRGYPPLPATHTYWYVRGKGLTVITVEEVNDHRLKVGGLKPNG